MKARFLSGILLSMLAATYLAGCNHGNIVSSEAPVSAVISGIVVGSSSPAPLAGVTVVLTHGSASDSIITASDGVFQFILDLPDTSGVNVTLAFRKVGYLSKTVTTKVKGDLSYPVGLDIDPAAYSVVTGVVRDSSSSYPIAGASVLISLPPSASTTLKLVGKMTAHGYKVSSFVVDSTSTLLDGSFVMNVNLFDLDSISATITVSKSGFKSYQINHTFTRGQNNFGTIPLAIDNSLSFAHVVGRVTDNSTGLVVRNATVTVSTPLRVDSMNTRADGSYAFDLNLQGLSSVSGSLLFRLNSYNDTTINFSVRSGQTLTQNAVLSAKPVYVVDTSVSGIAKTFKLIGVTNQEISITGASTGSSNEESSVITWQVLDSLNNPVDINHKYTVDFQSRNRRMVWEEPP